MTDDPRNGPRPAPKIDATVPHSARIWNYWLGGKDNYEVDRVAGDQFREAFPQIVDIARADRYFVARAVRYLATDAGVRQFLDVGTGLPTVDNTHEVAQRVVPECRIAYVDNDPLVLAHARALLTSTPEGACVYIDADMRDPGRILAEAAVTLDFTQPIALMFIGVLGHIEDYDEARSIVRQMFNGLPGGSYLAICDGINVPSGSLESAMQGYTETGAIPYKNRGLEEVAGFFEGVELMEPGVVPESQWRPDVAPISPPPAVEPLCGIGKKR